MFLFLGMHELCYRSYINLSIKTMILTMIAQENHWAFFQAIIIRWSILSASTHLQYKHVVINSYSEI